MIRAYVARLATLETAAHIVKMNVLPKTGIQSQSESAE